MPTVSKQSPKARPKKATGVLGRIKPIGFDPDDGIHILLYGKSGTGKTTLWSSFPGPILAVICSGSSVTCGELRSIDTPELRKKIKQVVLEETSELRTIVDHVKEERTFKTIVIDHASGLQDLALREILGLEELPAQKSWGMATQQQYGQCSLMCKEMFRSLLDLNCNVVIIAQERTFNDEGGSELISPTVGAALTPSVAGWLNWACDYVCQTVILPKMVTTKTKIAGKEVVTTKRGKGVVYSLRVEPHDIYSTKFRIPKGRQLPPFIDDPDYDKIISLING